MENRLSQKTLKLLCSPLSLSAMAVLLINDHILRRFWPSWITGKLGDLAWLLFFPFALAWIWALLLPRREHLVRGLAFGITGGIFALANTIPACHAMVVKVAEWMLGFPVIWVRDPSDLITLVSLAAGWAMWQKAPDVKACTEKAYTTSPRGLVAKWDRLALAAAALLTVANSAGPPPVGVEDLIYREGSIYGLAGYYRYEGYVSRDGGLSWESLLIGYTSAQGNYLMDGETQIEVSEMRPEHTTTEADRLASRILDVNGTVQYRYASGKPIERSEDGGATWHEVYMRSGSPADETYYERLHPNYTFYPGPLDAVADSETGNVIFAMGAEGALVQTPDGTWTWVEVGPARRAELRRGEGMWLVLQGELLLAAGFGLLAVMLLLARWRRSVVRKSFLALYWLLWGANVLLMPELRTGYPAGIDMMLMSVGCIYLLIHIGVEVAMTVPKQATVREVGRVALTGLLVAAVFLIPYFLWVLAVIPWYALAAGLGVALGVTVMVVLGRGRRQGS
jgi:hypothetical protein